MSKNIPSSQFIKPYSRGQITIPQDFRDYLGINEKNWLFLAIKGDSLIIKPIKEREILDKKPSLVRPKTSLKKYLKIVSEVKGSFGKEIEKENQKVREEVEERLRGLYL